MATPTTANVIPAPTTVQTIDSARHPVARRVADVIRSRSETPRIVLVDDVENVEQAVACGIELDSLYVTESTREHAVPGIAGVAPDVPTYILDGAVAKSLFGENKRSRLFALAHAPRSPRLHELMERPGDIVVLDGVRIVGNIGAITRTACGLGAAGVVLLDSGLRTTLDRRLVRASRGLVFATPVVLASRAQLTAVIQRQRLAVAALSADAPEPLNSIRDVPERLLLVMGGERAGVSLELEALTTHRYAIPMTSNVESLNVSVAAGIALYEHRAAGGLEALPPVPYRRRS